MESLANYELKKDLVVKALRDAIISGELQPGERVIQEEIASRLQVSSTPIREAIRELERDGLVVHSAHKGVSVAQVTPAQVRELFVIRSLLESKAAELAMANVDQNGIDELEALHQQMADLAKKGQWQQVARANRAFHLKLFNAAESPVLFEILERLWTRIPWAAIGARIAGRAQEMIKEHGEILRAMREGDPSLVAEKVREHCEIGSDRVAGYLEMSRSGQASID